MSEIHKALSTAMDEICRRGIGKVKKASTGSANYNYRGIDDAMNELSPILVRNGITVTPEYSDLTITERIKGDPADGKAIRFAVIRGSFAFAASDGSFVKSSAYGEAMDSGDKAIAKAQSVAFRTALFQQFVVPTMAMDPEADEYNIAEATEACLEQAQAAAINGTDALRAWWSAADATTRVRLGKHLQDLKAAAAAADEDLK